MLVGLLVASSSGAFFARRQSGPLTLRGDLSDGVHTIRLSSTIVPKTWCAWPHSAVAC